MLKKFKKLILRELDVSIENTARFMKIQEHLRHSEVIDTLDDERRTKTFALLHWNKNMQLYFISKLEKAGVSKKIVQELKEYNIEFQRNCDTLMKEELFYEEKDDNLRNKLMSLVDEFMASTRNENSELEQQALRKECESSC